MWPKNSNPTIARSLPRLRGLPQRFENPEAMAFNGIVYNRLLHQQETIVNFDLLLEALEEFCVENDIKLVWRKMKNNGNGGWRNGRQLHITMNRTLPTYQKVLTLLHEITHCLGHVQKNTYGICSFINIPDPVKEAEANIVEFRVASFFFPEKIDYVTSYGNLCTFEYRKNFNDRLRWFGPKQNVQTIREEQCVEFADNLILWLVDRLSAKGAI